VKDHEIPSVVTSWSQGSQMAEDRWYRVALPILEYVHEHGGQLTLLGVGDIADGTDLEPEEVAEEIEQLSAAGYLAAPAARSAGCPLASR